MIRSAIIRLSSTARVSVTQSSHASRSQMLLILRAFSSHNLKSGQKKRVAVIGAGPAGLSTTRQLAAEPDSFEVTCFERKGVIGGEWNYTDKIEMENGFRQTGLYSTLKTNTNRQCTEFPDFPFPEGSSHWLTHEEMHSYINAFAQRFSLTDYIKFKHQVERVWVEERPDGGHSWLVTVRDIINDKSTTLEYDAVVVCIGMLHSPVYPTLHGASSFHGKVIHSCQYRGPEMFAGDRVLVIGGMVSAWDMCWDLEKVAERIFISHFGDLMIRLHDRSESVAPSVELTPNSVILEDGREIEIDAIIYCTGYHMEYPFLDPSCDMTVSGFYIYPLYKRVMHPRWTSLFFVGTYLQGANWPNMWLQAKLLVSVLHGRVNLPTEEEMMKEINDEYTAHVESGEDPKELHRLCFRQPQYVDEVSKLAGIEPYSQHTSAMWCAILQEEMQLNYHLLRTLSFDVVDDHVVKRSLEAQE